MAGEIDGPTTGRDSMAGKQTDPGGPGESPGEPLPIPVGEYAAGLVGGLRKLPRVTITGELVSVSKSRVQHYFQLRDERGGVPCTMWKNDFEKLDLSPEDLREGAMVIARGGPDYYVGGKNASPAFSFRVTALRPAGEGDLLARLAALRGQFEKEGLFEPQKLLERPALPRRIGVITAEGGAARRDLLVGLERRGWQGEIVWGFAPVQDRNAAPAITRALSDMAAFSGVEAIVVCRGGGSLTDLWAFCDEDLCRTVAMLAVPVVSAVGHERDFTLIDDVAAVRCSTPTHAAEAAVPLDCRLARSYLIEATADIFRFGGSAIEERVRPLAALAGGPVRAIRQQRAALNQKTREIRASSERGLAIRRSELAGSSRGNLSPAVGRLARSVETGMTSNAGAPAMLAGRVRKLVESGRSRNDSRALALRAHDPQRTLERGYARVEDRAGEPVASVKAAQRARRIEVRFADGPVPAEVLDNEEVADFEQIRLDGVEDDR